MNTERILTNFLNAYWLRPETALWRTLDVVAMRDFKFASPSLDMGAGDGTFSFLRAGGEFDNRFDVFLDVDNLDSYFDNVDVYDSWHGDRNITVTKKAEYQIDYALDHKMSLMKKAERLGFYKNFVEADANKRLPFPDGSFRSVFSNMIYWLDDPKHAFEEIHRVLTDEGVCCVMLPDTHFLHSSFYYELYESKGRPANFKFLELIDRGRLSDNLKVVKPAQ